MKVVNLTGHEVTLVQWDGKKAVIDDGGYLHVYNDTKFVENINLGNVVIPLLEITEQELDLPKEDSDTLFIVSGVVAAKLKKDNFVIPTRVVRERGVVVGCRALARIK